MKSFPILKMSFKHEIADRQWREVTWQSNQSTAGFLRRSNASDLS